MNAFRVLLVAFIVSIIGFTSVVISNHGWDLFSIFFGDIASMNWPGQFNLDFLCFLLLSGLWLSWRHRFSLVGIVLGVFGLLGGIMFLAPYLLIASFRANGDIKTILMGKNRTRS